MECIRWWMWALAGLSVIWYAHYALICFVYPKKRMGQCFGILVKHWLLIVAALLEGLGWLVVWLAILGVVFPSKACNDR